MNQVHKFCIAARMAVGHFLYGFPIPHHASCATFQWIRLIVMFGGFTVLLAIFDIGSDIFFIVHLWGENKCGIAIAWLVFITTVPFLPILISAVKQRFVTHQRWEKAASLNWRLARQSLIKSEDNLLVFKTGERLTRRKVRPFEERAYPVVAFMLDIFPVTFVVRCISYVRAWRNSGEFTKYYTYSADIEFQDWQLQNAQLTEIKYEANPQLMILLILTATGLFPWSKAAITAAFSFCSIAKYFPFCAQLPGKCAFNSKVFLDKHYVDVEVANQLLKPHLSAFCGWVTNFFYIACRYHILISLIVVNWKASLAVAAIQAAIIAVFLLLSYRRKYSAPFPKKSWKRYVGPACAFISQLLTTLGYFLLVPVTTTMTMMGCVLGTILQGVAIVVYALVTHVDWTNTIQCHTGSTFPLSAKSSMYYALLVGNVFGSLLLPFLHYLVSRYAEKSSWLIHRQNCTKCLEFKNRYCNYRPCWLCEWAWCDEHDPQNAEGHTAHLNHLRKNGPTECTPVVMAEIGLRAAVDDNNRPMVELFHPSSPELADFQTDFHMSLHSFLRELYSCNVNMRLLKRLPYQIFYKSKLYDQGIKNHPAQNMYWAEIVELRQKHAYCGEDCLKPLPKLISDGPSRRFILTIEPANLPSFSWRLDKFDRDSNVVPDGMEYEFFNDADLEYGEHEPVQECPMKKALQTEYIWQTVGCCDPAPHE
ncbi:uncharacterized protein LOC129594582 isoform X2 [Paramacrobiotus metropolitanus]|uniref:uncharacterized protein LOC129594582 isoform X2 n=1 Tax=Paramacrobiotus metropolitanus TaxID=2943436 RepID=UPI0024465AEB|nr:uncharacterized protein LOC129594582 isoform X2 [Paramacrobiotus metropolitanus]